MPSWYIHNKLIKFIFARLLIHNRLFKFIFAPMFSGQRSLIILDISQLHAKDNDISSDNDIVKIFLSLRTSPKQSLTRVASDLILVLVRRILNNDKSENLSEGRSRQWSLMVYFTPRFLCKSTHFTVSTASWFSEYIRLMTYHQMMIVFKFFFL